MNSQIHKFYKKLQDKKNSSIINKTEKPEEMAAFPEITGAASNTSRAISATSISSVASLILPCLLCLDEFTKITKIKFGSPKW